MSKIRRCARLTAGTSLVAIGLLHIGWAFGCPWPAKSKTELADAALGSGQTPSPAVAGAIGTGLVVGGLLAGGAGQHSRLAALGRCFLAQALTLRGVLGLIGSSEQATAWVRQHGDIPEALDPEKKSPRFRELDRNLYTPLSLGLAGLITLGNCHRRHRCCGHKGT
jgi:hypothetical protein